KITVDSIMQRLDDKNINTGLTQEEINNLDSIASVVQEERGNKFLNFNFDEKDIDSIEATGATDEEVFRYMGMSEDPSFLERKFYAQMRKFVKNKDGGTVLQTFYDAIPIAMFFLLPIFALLVFLFYFNKGRFAHHLVFSFYFFSFLFAAFSILVGMNLLWEIPGWLTFLILLSTYFYLYFALKRYYKQGWFLTWIKSGFLTFMFMIIVLPLAAGMVLAYAFLFY
ncbi:MAG: hypothetical protein R3213_10375, partial [Flavobacteriaceae bacterium]|nr:hypothetical protein [Flavobacteriaceae bacterium]